MPAAQTEPGTEWYCPACDKSYDEDLGHCPDDGTALVHLKTRPDPLVGKDLDGRYTLQERIGAGGMGTVYRAWQHSVGREVAVKVIRPEFSGNPATAKRFFREATLPSKLSQPNIVSVLDFGQTSDGLLYLTMELLSGRTLQEVLTEDGVFPVRRAIRVAAQLCDALESAHALPIVHRDLKPGNIMLLDQPAGRDLIKVMDFGLAKSLAPDVTHVTRASALVGTPGYLAPEVAMGADADVRSDLYSVGVILYQLMTGRLPYDRHGGMDQLPAPMGRAVPPAFENVVRRLLERDAIRRLQSAAQLREALAAANEATGSLYNMPSPAATTPAPIPALDSMEGATLASPPTSTTPEELPFASTVHAKRKAGAPRRRSRRRLLGSSVGLAAIIGAVLAFVFPMRRPLPSLPSLPSPPAPPAAPMPSPSPQAEAPPVPARPAEVPQAQEEKPEPPRPARRPRRVAEGRPGYFSIESKPYATIYIDGKRQGVTPLVRLALPPGPHKVRAVSSKGPKQTFSIQVTSGEELPPRTLSWE